MLLRAVVSAILLTVGLQQTCRFAPLFDQGAIRTNATVLDDFIRTAVSWEAKYIRQVGVQESTGMTFDGQRVDYESGELIPGEKHYFSASSKESLHVALLAKVFEGNPTASLIYNLSEAVDIIGKKVNSLELFNKTFPGFGGFLPWFALNNQTATIQPTWDFKTRTPALDNGQLFWAAFALSSVWQKNQPTLQPTLRERFANVTWKLMLKNARQIFFNTSTGKIRAVANIQNISLPPNQNKYSNDDDYYLDDPYEGELFCMIVTLLSEDFTSDEISKIWIDKRKKLQPANYEIKELGKTVTVERGWWFSAHEQWKNLFMPYYLSGTYWKIFTNGEKVRTWNSRIKGINGLYAATTGTANSNKDQLDYFADCGLPEVSFQKINHLQEVTPYGSFPLFLASKAYGAVWYHNMLMSPSAQTKYGSLEATNVTGANVSPMLTWDTKITTIVAMLGGTTDIVEYELTKRGKKLNMVNRLELEYALAFRNAVGFDIDYALPNVTVRTGKKDFTTCTTTISSISS